MESKDVDYAVEAESFDDMKAAILERGGKIYVEHPEFLTVRAKMDGVDADFVLCRKDGEYVDGRRPETVEPGSIYDDLARRDFTMNAIAIKDTDVHNIKVNTLEFYDPFGGLRDIQRRYVTTVGNPVERFEEDTLRIIRAIRFAVTKGFNIDPRVDCAMRYSPRFLKPMRNLATERIRDELYKMFRYDTVKSIEILSDYWWIRDCVFNDHNIWLEPTMKGR